MSSEIKLGDIVRDSISGFQGKVTGIAHYIYGCNTALVEPHELKDGEPVKGIWFDIPRLELLEDKKTKKSKHSGGPQNNPPSRVRNSL